MRKNKENDEVWVRWFYIANWADRPVALKSKGLRENIRKHYSFYGPEFWEKATFAVYDGNSYQEIPAKEIRESKPEPEEESPCQMCGREGLSDHPCPYAEDIYGDSYTLCNCCDDCAYKCAMDT